MINIKSLGGGLRSRKGSHCGCRINRIRKVIEFSGLKLSFVSTFPSADCINPEPSSFLACFTNLSLSWLLFPEVFLWVSKWCSIIDSHMELNCIEMRSQDFQLTNKSTDLTCMDTQMEQTLSVAGTYPLTFYRCCVTCTYQHLHFFHSPLWPLKEDGKAGVNESPHLPNSPQQITDSGWRINTLLL